MTDLDTIRERHELGNINGCSLYGAGVDCDNRVVLDALERADAASVTAAISLALAAYDKDHGACLHRTWLTIDPPVCADCGKVGDER
jgi:hypothetical protein